MEVHRKQAKGPGGGERIRRQAELLTAARHPGVVELVGLEGAADRPTLVTVLVDGPTLAVSMPLTADEVAGVVGAVASTLADLHDLGIVHGSVLPEHVLLAPDGRPILCGFGSAGLVGDELQPSRDVAALGRLLRRLATGPEARALRRIADTATADDPDTRPSARTMAAEVMAAVADARLPTPAGGGVPERNLRALVAEARGRHVGHRQRRPRPPLRTIAVVAGLVTVAGAGLLLVAPWSSPATDVRRNEPPAALPAPPTTPRAAPSTTIAPPPSTMPPTRPDCPAPVSVLTADVDGDGCLDAVRYADGVLEAVGLRWALGVAGDQVATGDWSCRGPRTVALLRPSTGEVFRFDGWAVGNRESVTGSVVATVPGGQALRAADVDRDGCHEIVVERGELPPQVVRLPRPGP